MTGKVKRQIQRVQHVVLGFFLYRTRLVFGSILIFSLFWGLGTKQFPFVADATYLLLLDFWLVALTIYSAHIWRTLVKGNNFERYASIVVIIFILAITFTLNSLLFYSSKKYPVQFSAPAMTILLSIL